MNNEEIKKLLLRLPFSAPLDVPSGSYKKDLVEDTFARGAQFHSHYSVRIVDLVRELTEQEQEWPSVWLPHRFIPARLRHESQGNRYDAERMSGGRLGYWRKDSLKVCDIQGWLGSSFLRVTDEFQDAAKYAIQADIPLEYKVCRITNVDKDAFMWLVCQLSKQGRDYKIFYRDLETAIVTTDPNATVDSLIPAGFTAPSVWQYGQYVPKNLRKRAHALHLQGGKVEYLLDF